MKTNIFNLLKIFLAASFLSACVAIQPFPNAVRAGDTITLAIGSVDGANRNNVTLTYYADSDPATPIDLTPNLRSVVKIYPDKTSRSFWDTTSGLGLETINYMELIASHSAWQTVLVVDLPASIPPGTGHMEVALGAGVEYPLTLAKVDNVNISMEILENGGLALQGGSHDFEYRKTSNTTATSIGDLTKLEPLKQVVVRNLPNPVASYPAIAAAEFDLYVPVVDQSLTDVSDQVSNNDIAIVLDDQVSFVQNQANLNWSRNGSNVKVIITSLTGNLMPTRIRFSVVLSNLALETSNGWTLGANPAINSENYYDINGNPLTGPIPEIIVQ